MFTDGVMVSGAAVELYIKRGFLLVWSIDASREMRRRLPKYFRVSALVRMMPDPRAVRSRSSFWTKWTASFMRVDLRGLMSMVVRIDPIGQR